MKEPNPTPDQTRWKRRIRKMIWMILGLAAFLLFVVMPCGLSYLLTHAHTRPMDLKLTSTPADFKVPYREVQFEAPEKSFSQWGKGVPISAWYLPREKPKAVILYAHGLFRSRREMLERAAWLWKHGYAGLLLDLRRHGNSGGSLSGMGYLERLDIEAAVHFIRESLRLRAPLIGFGVSMGAAAMILAAAETPEIAALIVDSSFLSFENTITHHLKLFLGLPRFPVGDLLIACTRWRLGFREGEFDMVRSLQRLQQRPILIIAGGRDRRMPVNVQRRLFESAATAKKTFFVVPEATHGAAYRTDREAYKQAVLGFLETLEF